jgi:hypothetical protein
MPRLHFALLIAAALVFLPSSPSQAASAAGVVQELTGAASITRAGEKTGHPLKAGDAVAENDKIETAKGAHVKIKFADNTELLVAENGYLTIDKYIYDPANASNSKARFTILKTAFYYIGGLMEKSAKPDVAINLDLGTIGVRGTKIMRAMKNGECWIYLESGNISVSNKGGAVTLAPGQGTIMRATTQAPEKPHVWSKEELSWIKGAVFGTNPDNAAPPHYNR